MEPDTDRISRMKTLGEALDRARSRAEELCALLSAGIDGPADHASPRQEPPEGKRPSSGNPPLRR